MTNEEMRNRLKMTQQLLKKSDEAIQRAQKVLGSQAGVLGALLASELFPVSAIGAMPGNWLGSVIAGVAEKALDQAAKKKAEEDILANYKWIETKCSERIEKLAELIDAMEKMDEEIRRNNQEIEACIKEMKSIYTRMLEHEERMKNE